MFKNENSNATSVQVFNNTQFGEIRVAKDDSGEPLFCLKDLCDALNLSNNRKVASQLDEDVTRITGSAFKSSKARTNT